MAGPSLATRSQVPNATVSNDGLMTKEQAQQLAQLNYATDNFAIYASPTGVVGAAGDAANPTTIDDAFTRLPNMWDKQCRLYCLPGTYSPTLTTFKCGFQSQASTASPFVMIGDFTNEVGDRTSTAAAATGVSITDSALTLTLDQYRGYYISIIVAGDVQQRRMIIGNTTGGQFNVNSKFSPIPSAGAVFRVEKPAVIINIPSGGMVLFPKSGNWGMKGIQWSGTSANAASLAEQSSCLSAEGIWFAGASAGSRPLNGIFRGSYYRGVSFPTAWAADGSSNPFSSSRTQAGTYFKFVQPAIQAGRVDSLFGIFDNCSVSATESSTLQLLAPFAKTSSFAISRNATLTGMSNDTSASPITTVMDGNENGISQLLLSDYSCARNITGSLQMNNSVLSAIQLVRNGSIDRFGSTGTSLPISGTGATRYGLEMSSASAFSLQNPNITLTGTLGDAKCGNRGVITWTNLRAQFPLASAPLNIMSDFVSGTPFKKTFTGLVAADSFDLTSAALGLSSPALVVMSVRVTAGTASFVGSYAVTDTGGTALTCATGSVVGLAKLSDDGTTITFPTGANVTAFVIIYVPVNPANCTGCLLTNSSA